MSLIVTVALVATIVPDVDTVLSLALNDSVPSVVKSFERVTENDPELFVIDTDPPAETAFAGEEKSVLFTVPLTASNVQYKVPEPKLVVVTVNVTDEPSFTEVGLADME